MLKAILGILIVSIAVGFLAYSYGTYHPTSNSELVKKMLDDKLQQEKINYDNTIKEKQSQIDQLNIQLQKSQNMVVFKQSEINKLKKKSLKVFLKNWQK